MEVHHHSHSEGKRLKHYLFEFFMLFLAVFSGFLAENFREHQVEHQREKQYMKLMIEDLKSDTTLMHSISAEIDTRLKAVDSLLMLLNVDPLPKENISKAYRFTYPALNNLTFKFNDRTITQLKNSGNMRLIRSQKVNDGIINYWNEIENIIQASARHSTYRAKGRDLETKIFNIVDIYLRNDRSPVAKTNVRLINTEPLLVQEYGNTVESTGVMLDSIKNNIKNQLKSAEELINVIKKEYNLE